jgi:hypothetical protein
VLKLGERAAKKEILIHGCPVQEIKKPFIGYEGEGIQG